MSISETTLSTVSPVARDGDVAVASVKNQADSDPAEPLTSYEWFPIGLAISLAGGAYPLLFVAFYTAAGCLFAAYSVLTGNMAGPAELIGMVFSLFFFAVASLYAVVSGVVWAAVVSAVTLPVVYLFARSLALRGSIVRLGAFCGGLVGFIAVLPVFLVMAYVGMNDLVLTLCVFFLFGPAITTILGQIAGAIGGQRSAARRIDRVEWKQILASTGKWSPPESRHQADGADRRRNDQPARLQFQIRHLLWIAVWLSVLLTVIRLAGIPFEYILPLLGGWVIYQAFTLYSGAFLIGWLSPKWQARRQAVARETTGKLNADGGLRP